MDRFEGGHDSFLLASDSDFVHNLALMQWDVTDDIGPSPFLLTLQSGCLWS